MDVQDQENIVLLRKQLSILQKENVALREEVSKKKRTGGSEGNVRGSGIPLVVLKNAFNSNSTLAENASIVKWEDVSSDEKKKLMNSLKNEMLANGITVPIANIMFARARKYYNNLRARFLRNTDPEKRRDLRKRSKLHVYSHRKRNEEVKEARATGLLDTTNTDAVKRFRASISPVRIAEIDSPPNSDDEEGKKNAQRKRMEALAAGRAKVRKCLNEARQKERQMNQQESESSLWSTYKNSNNPTPTPKAASTPEAPHSHTPYPKLSETMYRNWYKFDDEWNWPWEKDQKYSFGQIKQMLDQKQVYTKWGTATPSDMLQIIQWQMLSGKVMHHLLSSATQFVNRKMEEPIAKNFLPFSITKIKNEGDGFKICDDHFQNQIYKLREQTQHGFERKYLITPVVRHRKVPTGSLKNSWTIAIAIVEQERKLLAYLDPLGEDLDEDIEKMKYFYDNITNVRGDWLLLTNSKYLEQKETEVQTAKKPEQSGMYCFLYALQIMTSQTYPKELDYTQITSWVINTVLRNSEEDEDEDDVVSDDDETQFNI